MKAVVFDEYGPPDVLQLREVEKPVPGDDEVLVKIHAASVNFGDTALLKGKPFMIRLMGYGLRRPKYHILGTDIAGRVEVVGRHVERFRPGDEVYGDVGDCGLGAFAEYVAVPQNALAPKPANLSMEQAAAVPQAAVVALQGLRDQGQIQSGQQVLINGASGGIGIFAVQIAKALGAEVTGVCSARHVELVRSIGADHVIDYTQEDFTRSDRRYDLIFDIVANHSVSNYLRALTDTGNYVACAFNPSAMFLGPFITLANGKRTHSLSHKPLAEDLLFMTELLEAGKVVPVIDACYPLSDLADAVRHLEAGGHHGKVVISVADADN